MLGVGFAQTLPGRPGHVARLLPVQLRGDCDPLLLQDRSLGTDLDERIVAGVVNAGELRLVFGELILHGGHGCFERLGSAGMLCHRTRVDNVCVALWIPEEHFQVVDRSPSCMFDMDRVTRTIRGDGGDFLQIFSQGFFLVRQEQTIRSH